MKHCTGCGSLLDDGAKFCTNCGMRVQEPPSVPVAAASEGLAAASAPAVAPVAPEPQPAADFQGQSITPSSGASTFVVVICVILILLIGAAISATLYLHKQRIPKEVAEQTVAPQSAGSEDSYLQALNLGSYPAATPVAIVTLNGEKVIAGFLTKDRPDQVMQYYKVRFPTSEVTTENATSHLSATLPNNQRIRVDAEPQGTNTQVKIVQIP